MHKMVNGVRVELTQEEIDARLQEEAAYEPKRLEAAKNRVAKKLRKLHYPSIEEQLDILYHGGFDEWKAAIKAVKDRFPKK